MKLQKSQQEELFFILERENKKLEEVFAKIKNLKSKNPAFILAQSYYQDMKHFFEKKEYVKAFELQNYVWGMLDALAINKTIQVPKEMQKWFKTDFS